MTEIDDLEEFIKWMQEVSFAFYVEAETQEDKIYYHNEPAYRRFFDVATIIFLNAKNYQIPGYSAYYDDALDSYYAVDEFHRTLLKSELGKLNWDVQFLHFYPGEDLSKVQDEDQRNFIEAAIEDSKLEYYYDHFDKNSEYMCIVLDNKEIVKSSKFWDKELESKRNQYLNYICSVHDCCLSYYKEVGRDRIRYCILITEYCIYNEIEFLSLNMYYCTPAAIIAARLLDELCKAD